MSDEITVTLGPPPGDNPYLQLGRAIAGQCPSGFEEARLEAELRDGPADLRLDCTPAGGIAVGLHIPPEGAERIQALLEQVRESGGEGEWRRCTVTLRKGGHFSMDVHG